MITLYQSNKTEILLDQMAAILRKPLSNPLAPETIVVQSKGMERWLSLKLAEHLGCCANIQFPFPNGFVRTIFDHLLPEVDQTFTPENPSAFDVDVMTWKLMKIIPNFLDHEAFAPIKKYLTEDAIKNLKQLQICSRIADTFDQYVIYRPEMIHDWEKGKDNHWQAILWRALCENVTDFHDASLGKMAIEKIYHQNSQSFTERLFVFGISALPRFHTQLLISFSHICDVHFFLLNPSQEYWGEIKSKREMSRIRFKESAESDEQLFLEEGHPLLASMGTLGKHFLNILFDYMDDAHIQMDVRDCFETISQNTLLTTVQNQLLTLNVDKQLFSVDIPDDHSIVIHSCHSPMREVEVLYDQLLSMFETDPNLSPRDVLVMTPDIETYAPFIQAVFDNPEHQHAIPYSIADRNRRKESQIIDTFLMILDLPGSRLEAGQMLSILECPAVSRRFNILPEDLPTINHWVEQTRIRWGESGEFRTQFGMAAYPENTWQNALDRLLLGYAMPGESEHPFCGILPFDAIEGQYAVLVGYFVHWASTLFKKVRILDTKKSLNDWITILNSILDDCFLPDDHEDIQMTTIRDVLHRIHLIDLQLDQATKTNETSTEISFAAIKWFLTHTLEKPRSHLGFLSGHVTCCAMLPMRAIPFKVICMIGLNDTDYPRKDSSPNFNLIAQHPKQGDRSIRNDDRYIFLEAILSARKSLYISYVGHHITDNAIRPPSVLISDLLDYLDNAFVFSKGKAREALVIHHRLQAFHPSYFTDENELFSYSSDNCAAAVALMDKSDHEQKPFCSKSIDQDMTTSISIADLIRFFKNPIQYFFNHRMGFYLQDKIRTIDRREPFQVDGLDRYLLNRQLLNIMLSKQDPYDYLDQSRAGCLLPLGEMGRTAYYDLIETLKHMSVKVQPLIENPLPDIEINLNIAGITIIDRIKNYFERGLVFYRPAIAKANDFIESWVNHLIVSVYQGSQLSSWFVGKNSIYEILPVDNSRALLEDLMSIFLEGQKRPVHFFSGSSFEFMKVLLKGKTEEESLAKAINHWEPKEHSPYPSESENIYYEKYFQQQLPFDQQFIELSKRVFLPLNQSLQKVSLSSAIA
jgi:exodeoxyribonuclease V gamma subunit